MLSAALLRAYLFELIFSDARERERLLAELNVCEVNQSGYERDAQRIALNLCNAVFSKYPPMPDAKRGKHG
jgi:hypothetical protein